MYDALEDRLIRTAAFDWLRQKTEEVGDVLPLETLSEGFLYRGQRVLILTRAKGIFKPEIMRLPLSIRTSTKGPYDDGFGNDGLLYYRYRGTDVNHPDNVGLRAIHERGLPLVYLHGVVPGKYLVTWPVFVVGDDPATLTFQIQVDDAEHLGLSVDHGSELMRVSDPADEGRRRYMTSLVRRRLHQRAFRERVLRAYREQCAFCRFRHAELLDAAHIVSDADELGEPLVVNGLALCKIHHAAFDRHFLGVRPDRVIEVRPDLLHETDGPTLVHAIQRLHGQSIYAPSSHAHRPDEERLARRYALFLEASRAA